MCKECRREKLVPTNHQQRETTINLENLIKAESIQELTQEAIRDAIQDSIRTASIRLAIRAALIHLAMTIGAVEKEK